MTFIIDDITLSKSGTDITINLSYSEDTLPENSEIKSVLLERYIIPKTDEYMPELKNALHYQGVVQYLGVVTAHMSKTLAMGGGNIGIEPTLIDITKAWQNMYPKIVDTGTDTDEYVYLYRIVTYGTQEYEKDTRFVAGLDPYEPILYNDKIRDIDYIRFIDRQDLEELLPDNADAIIQWINGKSYFHETYRLRKLGEHESYKFSSYWQRAWMSLYFLKHILDITEQKIYGVQEDIYGIHT